MELVKTPIKSLIQGILDRHLPIVDTISPLLDQDPVKATRSIVTLLSKALGNFSYYHPLMIESEKVITGPSYTFHDNYEEYAKGHIPYEEMELIPEAIARVSLGGWTMTANYWQYQPPVLQCADGEYTIRAVYDYPMFCEYTSDGLLTGNSHVFGLEKRKMNFFTNILDFTFLSSIKARSELVKLPFTVDFLNFDAVLADLREQMDEDKNASAAMGMSYI